MKFTSWCFNFFIYLMAILLIAWFDIVVGIQMSLWIFYGIPIGLATWNFGKTQGVIISIVSSVIISLVAFIWGHTYSSTNYLVVALISKFVVYFALVWLVNASRKSNADRIFIPDKNK